MLHKMRLNFLFLTDFKWFDVVGITGRYKCCDS